VGDPPSERTSRPTRSELDAFVEHHRLGAPAVEALFALAEAGPSREEKLGFARTLLWLGGVLSLLAAVVFFVAANWEALGRLARFALLQALLIAAAGVALWRPPPARAGRLGLLAAFVLSGALLALFGQTYQTGADVHELFFAWAALGLPLVIAGRWAVTWGAWALVLNVAFALLCGWLPGGHVLWMLLVGWGLTAPLLFVLPLAVNLALWLACEAAARTRFRDVAAPWLGRFLLAAGIGFGTWGAVVEIAPGRHPAGHDGGGWILLAALALAAAGVGAQALRRRRDVFPLAILAGSAIAIGTVLIARAIHGGDAFPFFLITAWLVGSSTGAGWLLMGRLRRWRADGTLA